MTSEERKELEEFRAARWLMMYLGVRMQKDGCLLFPLHDTFMRDADDWDEFRPSDAPELWRIYEADGPGAVVYWFARKREAEGRPSVRRYRR